MLGVTRLRAEPVSLVAAGAVTPFGGDVDAFWSGLVTGGDAISMIERFPVDDLRVGRGGEIKKLRPLPGARRVRCRATQLSHPVILASPKGRQPIPLAGIDWRLSRRTATPLQQNL